MPEEHICSDCGAKLSPDTQGGLCVRCLFNLGLKTEAGTEAEPVAPTEKPGDRIGRYKLLQKIGEGGCGIVYMAEQEEPVRRRVALKVIKLGMDTREVIARFEAERQALALMDHPNIAKVLDGGATDTGRPYFVMELVRGVRITDYCDQNHLPTMARLDLFTFVCHAIQHAHQKGIIHRDIKPSNILVTVNDGVPVPKVIDFGIAKATQGRLTDKTLFTAFQQFLGTPAYMSPEQAEMTSLDIDTRSDIYSLGVLLYELLTGRTPFDAKELLAAGLDAMRRAIREQEPAKPSTRLSTMAGDDLRTVARDRHAEPPKLISLVRGDLDWIVMKCLEKDRTRRYETANGLAVDIQRHLKNEPVLASPPGNLYRFRKMMRRHKLAFAAGTLVLASFIISLGITTLMFVSEQEARKDASAVSTFLTKVLESPDRERGGRSITVAEMLDRAAWKMKTNSAMSPARQAEFRLILAQTYQSLGLDRDAIPLFEQGLTFFLERRGVESSQALRAMVDLGNSYQAAGRHEEAIKLQTEARRHKVKEIETNRFRHPLSSPLIVLAVLCICFFWVWMIVDCCIHEHGPKSWIYALLFFGIIAVPFYFFKRMLPRLRGGRNSRDHRETKN